jgi:hypothetical protein
MEPSMSDVEIDWARVAGFAALALVLLALGFFGYRLIGQSDSLSSTADNRGVAQIQVQLTDIEKRLDDLEKRRKAVSESSADLSASSKKPETDSANAAISSNPAKPKFTVSPASAYPVTSPPPRADARPDPAAAERLARIQEGIGSLQAETSSNQEALQATTNRLADVAGQLASQQGELGAQRGQILQSQDELNRFLTRTEHTPLTFELGRGAPPQQVGPVRLSLRSSNDKNQRYTLCIYIQNTCVETKDRVQYEVVQLAVSRDTAPLELIVTKIARNGIVGYLEVPRGNVAH